MWRDENGDVHMLEGPRQSVLTVRSAIVFRDGNKNVEVRNEKGKEILGVQLCT